MKAKNILLILAGTALLGFLPISGAKAQYADDYCIVDSNLGGIIGNTFKRAITNFNESESVRASRGKSCASGILLKTDVVLYAPIVITGSGNPIIRGVADDCTLANAATCASKERKILINDMGDQGGECAIKIAGSTAGARLEKITIEGGPQTGQSAVAQPSEQPAGLFGAAEESAEDEGTTARASSTRQNVTALCVEQHNNVITNVHVRGVKKGIVFRPGAFSNAIHNGSSVTNTEVAIDLGGWKGEGGDSQTKYNILGPQVALANDDIYVQTSQNYKLLTRFYGAEACVPTSPTVRLNVRGFVVDTQNDNRKVPAHTIFLYRVLPDSSGHTLLGYLAENPDAMPFADGKTGLELPRTSAGDIEAINLKRNRGFFRNGEFSFVFDTDTGTDVYLIAYLGTSEVAGSSKTYHLRGCEGDADEGIRAVENIYGNPPVVAEDGTITVNPERYGFTTVEECKQKFEGQIAFNENLSVDSDGDGLPDYLEVLNFRCDPVGTELTKWNHPDGDGDGILDGIEDKNQNGYVDYFKFVADYPADTRAECAKVVELTAAGGVTDELFALHEEMGRRMTKAKIKKIDEALGPRAIKIVGTKCYVEMRPDFHDDSLDFANDSYSEEAYKPIPVAATLEKGLPKGYNACTDILDETNPRQQDSDADGLADYLEDRSWRFEKEAKSHWYLMDGTALSAECTLSTRGKDAGVEYFFNKELQTAEGTAAAGLDKGNIYCKNDTLKISLDQGSDLNGQRESSEGESDPRNHDSDGDGLCDGPGCDIYTSCPDKRVSGVDGCPNTPNVGDMLNCTWECLEGRARGEAERELKRWKSRDTEKNDQSLTLEALAAMGTMEGRALADAIGLPNDDGDTVPQIFENMESKCSPGPLGLDPRKADTDARGQILVGGVADRDCSNHPAALKKAYPSSHRTSGCYIDRDGDSAFDCEEDFIGPLDGQTSSGNRDEAHPYGETEICNADSDNDLLPDGIELKGLSGTIDGLPATIKTSPNSPDTDGDGLTDLEEVVDVVKEGIATVEDLLNNPNRISLSITVQERGGDCPAVGTFVPTNPDESDTDRDGLSDFIELKGRKTGSIAADLAAGRVTGHSFRTNPLSKDSDGDGLSDSIELGNQASNEMPVTGSNPCARDTDEDTIEDKFDTPAGCALTDNPRCNLGTGTVVNGQTDSDGDGIPNLIELQLGLDAFEADGDNDGLLDGEEVVLRDGNYVMLSDPKLADSDGDGLDDYAEVKLIGTDPMNKDTDGDCIKDGLEAKSLAVSGIRARAFPGLAGGDTDPMNPDTDGDGLCDGDFSAGDLCIAGEDRNCNGIVDKDGDRFLETDPRTADTDFDGVDDRSEVCHGSGPCTNISRAVEGENEGCFNLGGAQGRPTSLFYLLGLILMWNRLLARKLKRKMM